VTREGEVGAGDELKMIARDANAVPVPEITRLYVAKRWATEEQELSQRAMRVAALPEDWKQYFRGRLQKMHA
jgi:MOSC domain-containing protein YiiM